MYDPSENKKRKRTLEEVVEDVMSFTVKKMAVEKMVRKMGVEFDTPHTNVGVSVCYRTGEAILGSIRWKDPQMGMVTMRTTQNPYAEYIELAGDPLGWAGFDSETTTYSRFPSVDQGNPHHADRLQILHVLKTSLSLYDDFEHDETDLFVHCNYHSDSEEETENTDTAPIQPLQRCVFLGRARGSEKKCMVNPSDK